VQHDEAFEANFIGRGAPTPGRADADVVAIRRRHIGLGMREQLSVTNHGMDPLPLVVEVHCDVDFADLFEVKESRSHHRRPRTSEPIGPRSLRFAFRDEGHTKEVTISFSADAELEPGVAVWRSTLEAGATWELCTDISVNVNGEEIEARFRCGGDDAGALPARRINTWRTQLPTVHTDHPALAQALARSASDLGALRIFDPDHPETPILAAGAPWFMTVFGRDSLLTSWMTLIADADLAHGVLRTLARFQGTDVDPTTEEEPGKILHEMRFGTAGGLSLGGGDIYYGTIDATPLFVMLLGELRRWYPADAVVDELLPHADRALDWIEHFGDRDGDGYVEYQRSTDTGLVNQGWKDSWDAVRFADGRLAEAPIALCEVQGYVYAAYVARAHFAREAGDEEGWNRWSGKAQELRRRFNEDFWLEEHGTFALGLDRDKRPIDAVASNVGHCLWTGIVEPERAERIVEQLMSDDSFTGFGVRTLSGAMRAFNPISYHNGSVWPHDNALCAAGLARYGFTDAAHRIIEGQLAVSAANHGALPELFAGFSRSDVTVPAPYPTSCSPQAWAAASPLLWLRTILRLDPWASHGQIWVAPELPPSIRRLNIDGIRIGGRSISVRVDQGGVDIGGAEDLKVVREPRPPLSVALEPH
jgi:glycogen debranching enzyme